MGVLCLWKQFIIPSQYQVALVILKSQTVSIGRDERQAREEEISVLCIYSKLGNCLPQLTIELWSYCNTLQGAILNFSPVY